MWQVTKRLKNLRCLPYLFSKNFILLLIYSTHFKEELHMAQSYYNYINGEWVPSKTNETYASINPANTEEKLGYFQQSNESDVELAIQAAESAFYDWSHTAAPTRGDVIFKLIGLLEEKQEELATIITKEVGKSFREANGEVRKTIEAMKQFSGEATRLTGETVPSHDRDVFGYTVRSRSV